MLFTNGRHNRPDEREEGVEWIKHVLWKERKVVVCTNLIWLLLYTRKRWGISLRFNFKCKKGRMFVTLHTGSASLLFSAPRYETRHGHVTHTPPLYTAHRDTHLSLLGKILPPPHPPSLHPVYSIIPPAVLCPSVFIKRNGLCDRRRSHLFTILLITVEQQQ
jgi:hypothetical protein